MKHSAIHGIALIMGSVGAIVTMIFHPSGVNLHAPPDQIDRAMQVLVATHTLALVSIPLLFFGFMGLSRRLGWDHALASAALVAYGIATVFGMGAAIANGLVAPNLIRQMVTADESTLKFLLAVFNYNGELNQALAKVFVTAYSIAVIFWSVSILKIGRFAQIIGLFGCVIGLVSLAAFFSGNLILNVHGFGLFIFAQAAWAISLGVLLCRSDGSTRTA